MSPALERNGSARPQPGRMTARPSEGAARTSLEMAHSARCPLAAQLAAQDPIDGVLPAQHPDPSSVRRRPQPPARAKPCSNACAASHAVLGAVLCCCTTAPVFRNMFLTSGAKGTRTPDPLLAKQVLFQLSYSPAPRRFKGTRSAPAQRAPQQGPVRGAAPAEQPRAAKSQAAHPAQIQVANRTPQTQ
jgi:hypothetical protein